MALTKEEAIGEAERQVKILTNRFDSELPNTMRKLAALIKAGNFNEASILTHNLSGEAATFGWDVIGDYASRLTKVLQEPNMMKRKQLVAVGLQSLELLCQQPMKHEAEAAQNLLDEFSQAISVLKEKQGSKV